MTGSQKKVSVTTILQSKDAFLTFVPVCQCPVEIEIEPNSAIRSARFCSHPRGENLNGPLSAYDTIFCGMTRSAFLGGLLLFGLTALLSAFSSPLFSPPQILFEDIRDETGIDFQLNASPTENKYLIETMGGGVGIFDYDQDGWMDIFFVNGTNLESATRIEDLFASKKGKFANRLYRNRRDGTFQDVTDQAGLAGSGYGMGVATGDYDNDGDLDLYVTGLGKNHLYRNNGDGTFTDVTSQAGVEGGLWSVSAVFVDYNHDGHLDLYVVRYLDWSFDNNPYCGNRLPGQRSYCHPDEFQGVPDLLFKNNGDGTFTDVSAAAGIALPEGKGLGVAVADFNRDSWIDLYVANDSVPSFLFENNGDGTFTEVGLFSGVALNSDGEPFAGMGVDFQDYDNDGWPDLVVTALSDEMYMLYRNNGDGTFTDVRLESGIDSTFLLAGWGVCFFDFDNDGLKDIFTANSHVMDTVEIYYGHLRYEQSPLLFRNQGDGKFRDVSSLAGPPFQERYASRGLAVGDLDNDGDLDLVVSNLNEFPLILENARERQNNWIQILLKGRENNLFGFGATVEVESAETRQFQQVGSGGSYLSAGDPRLHFGLGTGERIERIVIRWPGGPKQMVEDVAINQQLQIAVSD